MPRSPTPKPPAVHPLLAPGAPRPLLDDRRRQFLVRLLRRLGGELGLYPRPKLLAAPLGVRLMWRNDLDTSEGALELQKIVPYDHDPDPRQCRLNELLAIVGVFLRRQRVAHNASDIWLVALDFAVPMEAGSIAPEDMIEVQPNCPEALIHQVMAFRRGT